MKNLLCRIGLHFWEYAVDINPGWLSKSSAVDRCRWCSTEREWTW